MFCVHCGNKMDEDTKFCSKCGRVVTVATEDKEEPKTVVYENPAVEKEKDEKKHKILLNAILGLAFAAVGFVVLFTLAAVFSTLAMQVSSVEVADPEYSMLAFDYAMLGLVSCFFTVPLIVLGTHFSLKARGLVIAYIAEYGETDGKATVGKSVSIPGRIMSFVGLGFTALYVLECIVLMVV